jgi:trk system potassium uptake protein TrkH
VALGFAVTIAIGTLLLLLPFSTEARETTTFMNAFFTATSATTITGLAVVDTGSHWSGFGQFIIIIMMQVGGFGVMTVATLLAATVTKSLSLEARSAMEVESRSSSLKGMKAVIRRVLVFVVVIEGALAVILTAVLFFRYEESFIRALESGTFHAISAFNNGGLSLYSDSLTQFATDPLIIVPICIAIMIGGLGFPVMFEMRERWLKPRQWSMLTRITMTMSIAFWVLPTFMFAISEADNNKTWGLMSAPAQVLNSFFLSVNTRSGGFNAVDTGALHPESLLLTDILMFIGGGSAGTAGGVKVTTVGVLAYVVLAEVLARRDVVVGRRRISTTVQRQALSVFALSATAVIFFTFILLAITPFTFDEVLFETISAYATVGLSMGITPELSTPAQLVVALMMFIGRIGPLVFATALAISFRTELTRVPEERIIIG